MVPTMYTRRGFVPVLYQQKLSRILIVEAPVSGSTPLEYALAGSFCLCRIVGSHVNRYLLMKYYADSSRSISDNFPHSFTQ